MIGPVFHDTSEVLNAAIVDCPLAIAAEGKVFDKPDLEYDKPIDPDIRNCPIEHGSWKGERGSSEWIPDPDYVPKKSNPEGKNWEQIMGKYAIFGIVFRDGEPVFDNISRGDVKIEGFSANRDDNFDKADIALAKQRGCSVAEVKQWRDENGYTWHECKDMETMQKVPREIHNNIPHRGGVSEAKFQKNS